MDYPLEKLFECCFFLLGFDQASYILEIRQFENSKIMALRK